MTSATGMMTTRNRWRPRDMLRCCSLNWPPREHSIGRERGGASAPPRHLPLSGRLRRAGDRGPGGPEEVLRAPFAALRARVQRTDHVSTRRSISPRDPDDSIGRVRRALKGRLGHYARPEGRDEPFRARAFAEPAL